MNRNRKKLHGAVAIETALTLPVFMIAIIAIMMFAMLFRAQSAMQYALNQTAKEISGYFYLLDKLGVASVLSGNATDEARADVQDVNTTIDHIVSFSSEIKDASGKYKQTYLEYKESFENGSLTVEDIKRIQNIKDEALEDNKALQDELDKIKDDLNTIKNGDKRKMLKGILQVFGKSMINRVVSKYATPYICEALMPKYLTDGDVNAFYRAAGIIPESISFADSKMLSDGRTISLDVTYKVDASKLSLGFYRKELKFHQIATTSAWIRKNESGSLLSLSDLNAMFFGENSGELVAEYLANIQAEEDAKTTAATEVTTEADNESTSTVSSTTIPSGTDVSSTDSSETSTKSTETSTEVSTEKSTVSSDSSEVSSKSTQSTSTTTKPQLPQIDQSDSDEEMSKPSSGYFTNTSDAGKALIAEVQARGDKITSDDVIGIAKDKSGKIIWLEKGTLDGKPSGLKHILDAHEDNFNSKGIATTDIADFVLTAVTEGVIIDYQGKGTGRPIYKVTYNGKEYKVAVTVGSNGYIVGANPRS